MGQQLALDLDVASGMLAEATSRPGEHRLTAELRRRGLLDGNGRVRGVDFAAVWRAMHGAAGS